MLKIDTFMEAGRCVQAVHGIIETPAELELVEAALEFDSDLGRPFERGDAVEWQVMENLDATCHNLGGALPAHLELVEA